MIRLFLLVFSVVFLFPSHQLFAQDKPFWRIDRPEVRAQIIQFLKGGARGQDAKHGSDGSHGSSGGGDGGNGQDAGPSTRGKNGKHLFLNLEASKNTKSYQNKLPTLGAFYLEGTITSPDGDIVDIKRNTLQIEKNGKIWLYTRGGDGGHGGIGGDGGDGGRGSSGSDATRYSSGGDGGPGGDGGANGLGSSGSRAGDGGNISIQIKLKDLYLLPLIEHDLHGGSGGKNGRHGSPGSGGSGGSGGSSYSWTETETEYYTDSDGNTQSRTNTTYHSNPGGSSGRSGSSGQGRSSSISSGSIGEDGKYVVRVIREDKSVDIYNDRYRVEIQSGFEIIPDKSLTDETKHKKKRAVTASGINDNILEPGTYARVRNLVVKNSGEMPLPKGTPIIIYIAAHQWVNPVPMYFTIKDTLAPGKSQSFSSEDLIVKFPMIDKKDVRKDGKKWEHMSYVDAFANQTGINVVLNESGSKARVHLTFPTKISPINALPSIVPGGAGTKVMFTIKNESIVEYGSMAEIKRHVQTHLKVIGNHQVEVGEVHLIDPKSGNRYRENGQATDFRKIGPGEEILIEAEFFFSNTVQPLEKVTIEAHNNLGAVQGGEKSTVQIQKFTIQAAKTYSKSEGSDILILTNHKMDIDHINAFKKFSKTLGKGVDIWDLSFYNFFDLAQKMNDPRFTLFEQWRGKTVILYNNQFQDKAGKDVTSDLFLSQKQFMEASLKHGISFVVVGKTESGGMKVLDTLMLPESADQEGLSLKEAKKLSQVIEHIEEEGSDLMAQMGTGHTITSKKTKWFGYTPKEHKMKNTAKKYARKLDLEFPEENFFVSYDFEPKVTKKYLWGLIKKYDVGKYEVIPTIGFGENTGKIVLQEDYDESILDPNYIDGEEFRTLYLSGASLTEKLEILEKINQNILPVPDQEKTIEALLNAILFEIAHEQFIVRTKKVAIFDTQEEKLIKLKRLGQHYKLIPFFISDDIEDYNRRIISPAGKFFIELIARLKFMMAAQMDWWEKWLLITDNDHNISSISNSIIDDFFNYLFKDINDKKIVKDLKKQINERMKVLLTEHESEAESKGYTPKEYALERFFMDSSMRKNAVITASDAEKARKIEKEKVERASRSSAASNIAQKDLTVTRRDEYVTEIKKAEETLDLNELKKQVQRERAKIVLPTGNESITYEGIIAKELCMDSLKES